MDNLLAARNQMALSLGFHIVFAVVGMAMPALMAVAELLYLRTGRHVYRALAVRWSKGVAILFAVGAVSGTVLSFELGLLWPAFMEKAGPLVGLPFSLEGYAFFLEAIFLGVYLYGWDRVSPRVHLLAGVGVSLTGLMSGVFVVAVNGWMNSPTGFELAPDGSFTNLDPWAAFLNPSFPTEALHMALAAYVSVAFLVLGIHAWRLRAHPDSALHQAAVRIAFGFAVVCVPLQLVSGDLSAKHIAREQPAKLAAAEAHFETGPRAPLVIGGFPDEENDVVRGAIELPALLSVLAFADPDAVVAGLDQVPRAERPPVIVTHLAFDVMVGCGMAMLALVGLGVLRLLRGARRGGREGALRALTERSTFLRLLPFAAPLGLLAVEAGWIVTEVGRQPWIIRGVMRTADAVTPMPGLWLTFAAHAALYAVLGVVVVVMLRAHVFRADDEEAAS